MKKIFLILPLLCLLFVSCDDLLQEESFTETGKDDYVKNASEAEVVLLGCYANLSVDGLYSYHLSQLFTLSTDLAQCEGSTNTSFREIPTNSHNASTSQIATTWRSLYSAIYNTNDFIETVTARMNGWSARDQELATVLLGEARSLRALYYFELVRWFGHVSLITSTADSRKDASEYTQADPKEVYRFIEADLKYAAEVLPWAADDQIRSNSAYRFSRGAALGLLSKVYVTWAGFPIQDQTKWTLAADAAKLVIQSGKHALLPNYEQLWKNTCNGIWDAKESLIEVSFYSPTGIEGNDAVGRIGKWNGVQTDAREGTRGRNAANWKVLGTFSSEWEALNDPRYALSVADYVYGYVKADKGINIAGKVTYEQMIKIENPTSSEEKLIEARNKKRQLFNPAKWDTEKYVEPANALLNNDRSNVNWYVLRYADVLLLYAEALTESNGSMTDAVEAVNVVRRRGFGDTKHDLSAALSRDELREAIRKERAYELCFEGHRRQDLIRWGIYYETILKTAQEIVNWYSNANYAVAKYTQKNKHELFPIPQRDFDMMQPNYQQNTGWGK
ncbi:MAG: RagB/SusD family nutrient uptake outer membrane protein [Alistipes sp.]